MNTTHDTRHSLERGGARLNLIILLLVIATLGYVGYQYVPVAYQASLFKVYMQDTVDKAAATGQETSWVETQLRKASDEYDVPSDAVFKIEKREGRIEATATWTHPIVLPMYIYEYDFNHTVKSTSFLKKG